MKFLKRFSIIASVIFSVLGLSATAFGQCVSLTTSGAAYTQNFDTLSNTAGSTTNNLTITGWFMTESGGGARDNEQYGVDTGASTTGDTYSYGAAGNTERALGQLRSGTLISTFGSCYTNNTGATIDTLDVVYTGEQWRLGTAARTDQINFEYSTNATDLVTGTWTGVSALNFVTPNTATTGAKDGNAAANRTALSSTIPGLSIPNGATFWIRWTDADATSADDGLAVDDFSLTPQGAPVLPDLSINDVALSEGNAGTTDYMFTVSLSSPAPAGGVMFDIATADGTATIADNDYVQKSLTSQIIPQGSTTYFFNVTVNGDATVESDETFFVNVTNITGANAVDTQGQGTIQNDDAASPVVAFENSNYQVDESQTVSVFVVRTGSTGGTTSVDYTTGDSSLGSPSTGGAACTAGVDYITQTGTLTFNPGDTMLEIQIPTCGDALDESFEIFSVQLSNVMGGTPGKISNATVEITDTASQFVNGNSIGIGTSGDTFDSNIVVTNAPATIGSMRVTLFDFDHFQADNIDVLLVGPQGQNILLMADAGGSTGLNQPATITFTDNAGQVLPDNGLILTGNFEPTTWEPGQTSFAAPAPAGPYNEPGSTVGGTPSLASVFGGTNANGTWTLYIRDDNNTFQPLGIGGSVSGGWGLSFIGPTAAGVSVGGQVTNRKTPVKDVTVMITGGSLTEPLTTRTNSFGYYSFEGLAAGQSYVVTVISSRYNFPQPSIVLNVDDNLGGVDFEAEEK
jgi:hypothetical protein